MPTDTTSAEAARKLARGWWKAGAVSHLFKREQETELATAIREAEERGAKREREACAKVAEHHRYFMEVQGRGVWLTAASLQIAALIRARAAADEVGGKG